VVTEPTYRKRAVFGNHGGTIRVESRKGGGTTFHIYLPASEGQGGTEEMESGNVLRGEGRILVVDDEEAVRRSAGKILKKRGYDVECSKGGREAVRELKKADPEAVVIVSSGYSDDPVLSHYGTAVSTGSLSNPTRSKS